MSGATQRYPGPDARRARHPCFTYTHLKRHFTAILKPRARNRQRCKASLISERHTFLADAALIPALISQRSRGEGWQIEVGQTGRNGTLRPTKLRLHRRLPFIRFEISADILWSIETTVRCLSGACQDYPYGYSRCMNAKAYKPSEQDSR